MTISIKLPEKNGFKTGIGTKVFTDDGHEIKGISDLTIKIAPNSIITATMTVSVSAIDNLKGIEGIVVIESDGDDDNN